MTMSSSVECAVSKVGKGLLVYALVALLINAAALLAFAVRMFAAVGRSNGSYEITSDPGFTWVIGSLILHLMVLLLSIYFMKWRDWARLCASILFGVAMMFFIGIGILNVLRNIPYPAMGIVFTISISIMNFLPAILAVPFYLLVRFLHRNDVRCEFQKHR